MFSNGTFFAEIYILAKKDEMGQALNFLVMEPGVHEDLIIDEPNEKNSPGTEFMNRHFFLLYYFLNVIFSPYPLYSLAQDKNHDPHGDVWDNHIQWMESRIAISYSSRLLTIGTTVQK